MPRVNLTPLIEALDKAEIAQATLKTWIESATGDQAKMLQSQVNKLQQDLVDSEQKVAQLRGQLKDAQDEIDLLTVRVQAIADISLLPL